MRPTTAAAPEAAPVRNLLRFIEILLHSIRSRCRRREPHFTVLRPPVGIASIIVAEGREFNARHIVWFRDVDQALPTFDVPANMHRGMIAEALAGKDEIAEKMGSAVALVQTPNRRRHRTR